MAGFEAVDSRGPAEQWIAVVLGNVAIPERLLGEQRIVLREGLDDMPRQRRDVAHRHQMLGIGPAGRILERAVLQADLARPLGHQLGKRFLGAGQALGEHDAGVVAGLHDDSAQQVFDRDSGVDQDEHLRPAHAPCLGAHRQRVGELEPPGGKLFEHDVERHQLAHGCRVHQHVRVLVEQDLSGFQIDQNRFARRGFDRRRRLAPKRRHRNDGRDAGRSKGLSHVERHLTRCPWAVLKTHSWCQQSHRCARMHPYLMVRPRNLNRQPAARSARRR